VGITILEIYPAVADLCV